MSESGHRAGLCGPPRIIVCGLLLTLLAGVCCFADLSKGTLLGDEPAFACTTDRMRASGDWVVPFITDEPHLNATPLYNWLTLAITPWFGETPLWYRFWSAVFGVGCVLLTFALGTYLFRAEVGLLAGLFLTFNRDFLFCHGIRFGGMDAMLAFFLTAAVLCYAWLLDRPGRAWPAWVLLGLCFGLAWLSKPPIFGGLFFTLIGLHHFLARRGEALAGRAAGPLLALAIGLVVAAPWYLLLWSRLGGSCLHALFVYNSVERALDPAARDPLCCHHALLHASSAFKLIEPALGCAFGCWLLNQGRRQWGLLLLLAGGFLLALSVAGKARNYIFYPFPLLSVLLAGLFLDSGPRFAVWCWPALARSVAIIGVVAAVALVGMDARKVLRTLGDPAWVHPPVGLYERLRPELERGRCRFVLFGFGVNSSNFEEFYYSAHMPLADRAADAEELKSLLRETKPTIVVLPPLTMPQPDLSDLRPELRIEDNHWACYTYPVLTFHGAADKLPAEEWAWLCRGSQP